MIHETLPVGMLSCNCSVIGDEISREAIVIDPGDDVSKIIAVLERNQLTVKMIVITHVVPAQNESCDAASAYPFTTPMLRVLLSEERRTWYSEPAYEPYSALVVECAATQGVPPAA